MKGVPEYKPPSAAPPEPTPAAALSTREGREYTLGDEEAPPDGAVAAAAAATAGESRLDGGLGPFTFDEFEAFYGAEEASKRWESAGRMA